MFTKAQVNIKGFFSSSNWINKEGSHPEKMSIIKHDKIVCSKEELKDSNWMYIGNEDRELIEDQLWLLKFHDDYVPIIRS